MRLVVLISLVAVLAQPGTASAHPLVDEGRKLYEDLEYRRAAETLERALADGALLREERIEGLKLLALSQATLNQHAAAAATFKKLLEMDPEFALDRSTTPRIRDLFERVRGTMPRPVAPAPAPVVKESELTMSHGAPAEARPGRPLDLSVTLMDPDRRAARVMARHRAAGDPGWGEVSMPSASGVVVLQVPGISIKSGTVEYYIVALDGNGRVLAGVGALEQPLRVTVREEPRPPTPIYKRWWFWTAAAVVVAGAAGAATAGVLLSRGGGTVPPGGGGGTTNVTVTFGNP